MKTRWIRRFIDKHVMAGVSLSGAVFAQGIPCHLVDIHLADRNFCPPHRQEEESRNRIDSFHSRYTNAGTVVPGSGTLHNATGSFQVTGNNPDTIQSKALDGFAPYFDGDVPTASLPSGTLPRDFRLFKIGRENSDNDEFIQVLLEGNTLRISTIKPGHESLTDINTLTYAINAKS